MAQIIWTEPALQELDEIADYISLDNPVAAKKLVKEAFDSVDRLKKHPDSGKKVEELDASAIYREIVLSPCRIFYRTEEAMIYIVHVIRKEQMLHFEVLKSR